LRQADERGRVRDRFGGDREDPRPPRPQQPGSGQTAATFARDAARRRARRRLGRPAGVGLTRPPPVPTWPSAPLRPPVCRRSARPCPGRVPGGWWGDRPAHELAASTALPRWQHARPSPVAAADRTDYRLPHGPWTVSDNLQTDLVDSVARRYLGQLAWVRITPLPPVIPPSPIPTRTPRPSALSSQTVRCHPGRLSRSTPRRDRAARRAADNSALISSLRPVRWRSA
jgi:hypothetical protein